MALIFVDGFDGYTSSADMIAMSSRWRSSIDVTYRDTGNKWGEPCVEAAHHLTSRLMTTADGLPGPNPEIGPVHIAFWMRMMDYDIAIGGTDKFFEFVNENDSDGIALRSGGDKTRFGWSRYGNSSNVETALHGKDGNNWVHVEIACKVDNTTGFFKCWIDGSLLFDYSGDTQGSAPSAGGLNQIGFARGFDEETRFDDIVMWDETGTDFSYSQLGRHRIETLTPTSNGDTVQFTPNTGSNYQNVDETRFHDGDTTYNYVTEGNMKDLYNCSNLGRTPESIFGVAVHLRCKENGAASLKARSIIKSNSIQVDGELSNVGSSVSQISFLRGKNASGGAWTKSLVDAIQIGVETEE